MTGTERCPGSGTTDYLYPYGLWAAVPVERGVCTHCQAEVPLRESKLVRHDQAGAG